MRGVELRLLGQVADAGALGRERLAREVLVHPGHDAEKGRLAGPVRAEDADLGVPVERQPDALEDLLALGRDLAQVLHGEDELGHAVWRSPCALRGRLSVGARRGRRADHSATGCRLCGGPIALSKHAYSICALENRIEYALPAGAAAISWGPGGPRAPRSDVRVPAPRDGGRPRRPRGVPRGRPMKVAITGASGLVGSALVPFLTDGRPRGRAPRAPGRRRATDEARWDPDAGEIDAAALEGVDAVVHLAGENIAGGRWTEARKALLRSSRVGPTAAPRRSARGTEEEAEGARLGLRDRLLREPGRRVGDRERTRPPTTSSAACRRSGRQRRSRPARPASASSTRASASS